MKRTILFFVSLTLFLSGYGQAYHTLSGTVRSARTGETLINASVKVLNSDEGESSNEYGFYAITLKDGEYEIEYSAIGYETVLAKITLHSNIVRNTELPDEIKNLETVSVTANTRVRTISGTQMGVELLSTNEIQTIPMLLGER